MMNKDSVPAASEISAAPKRKKDYFEVKIPRISFHDTPINTYLVFALVIFAFLLGMLTHKVLFLEQTLKAYAGQAVPAAAQADTNTAQNGASAAPAPAKVDIDTGKLPVLGDENAKVTIVEFSDFQCPYCERFYTDTFKQLKEKYIDTGKVKFAYRHFPLDFHPNSKKSHEASECANEQGKFWEYHNMLFDNQSTWSEKSTADAAAAFNDYAGQLGLDTAQFSSCLESDKYAKQVDDDIQAGAGVQVDGTPAFFVNGNRLSGAQPFSEFEKMIEAELKK